MEFVINNITEFVKKNRDKCEQLVDDLYIIGHEIPYDDYEKVLLTGIEKYPKFNKVNTVLGIAFGKSEYFGGCWYDILNWEHFIGELDNEINQFVNHFKEAYPKLF